jgi:transcriptional regulator with XRE-family HTH domain
MSRILQTIRQAIRESTHSRYAISKALGIDQGQLSKLMKGEAGLSLERIEQLADFFDLEIIIRPRKRKSDGEHKS